MSTAARWAGLCAHPVYLQNYIDIDPLLYYLHILIYLVNLINYYIHLF